MTDKIRKPCANCPWRKDAPREYWDPTHFTEIWKSCQDDGLNVMRCHKSTAEKLLPCQGWVRTMGYQAIGVRLAVVRGIVSDAEVQDKTGPELFKTFGAMLRANKIKLPDRNRVT